MEGWPKIKWKFSLIVQLLLKTTVTNITENWKYQILLWYFIWNGVFSIINIMIFLTCPTDLIYYKKKKNNENIKIIDLGGGGGFENIYSKQTRVMGHKSWTACKLLYGDPSPNPLSQTVPKTWYPCGPHMMMIRSVHHESHSLSWYILNFTSVGFRPTIQFILISLR